MPLARTNPAKKTRTRKRKSRTEISSSSSSSSSEASDSSSEALSDESDPENSSVAKRRQVKDQSSRKVNSGKETVEPQNEASSKKAKKGSSKTAASSAPKVATVQEDAEDAEELDDAAAVQQRSTKTTRAAAFENWYLRAATAQFADDLSALRSAADFGNVSVPMLVHALRQGAGMISGEFEA